MLRPAIFKVINDSCRDSIRVRDADTRSFYHILIKILSFPLGFQHVDIKTSDCVRAIGIIKRIFSRYAPYTLTKRHRIIVKSRQKFYILEIY